MAGFIVDTEQVASLAVDLLKRELVLVATVSRVGADDYKGSGGRTTLRVPVRRTAKTQPTPGDPIDYTAVDEVPVPFDLVHLYDAVRLTDETVTLDIVDFGRQVLEPMVSAVAEGGEGIVADVMNGVVPSFPWTDLTDATKTRDDVLAARELLASADVPSGARYLACSPSVTTALLKIPEFVKANESGSDSALREAIIGRVFSLTVLESSALDPDTAVAYHRSGFAFASLGPALPQGGAAASSAVDGGVALRILYGFDPGILSDIVAISTFAGASLVDADRVVRIGETESS